MLYLPPFLPACRYILRLLVEPNKMGVMVYQTREQSPEVARCGRRRESR